MIKTAFDANGITLDGVPNSFQGGLAVGLAILVVILRDFGCDNDEIADAIHAYRDHAEDMITQLSAQVVAELGGKA